jgi:hypothetical protein
MSRRDEYIAHLRSPEWAVLREQALRACGGFCSFCNEPAIDVHHVVYPKQFSQDSLLNLRPVCRRHHEVLHGMESIQQLVPAEASVLRKFGVAFVKTHDGFLGTTFENWLEAFQIPMDMEYPNPDYLRAMFDGAYRSMRDDNAEANDDRPLVKLSPKGEMVYSWEVTHRAIRSLYDELKVKARDKFTQPHDRMLFKNIWVSIHRMELQISDWIKAVMAGETVSIRHPAHKPTEGNPLLALADVLLASAKDHDGRLVVLEDPMAPLKRALLEWGTTADAVVVMGLSATREWPGSTQLISWYYGRMCSKYCRDNGITFRPKSAKDRFPTQRSAFVVPANQYPKAVLIAVWPAFFAALQEAQSKGA